MNSEEFNSLKVLILSDYYLPGYKGGGPIRTLSNVVERFGDEVNFNVITRDRDCGDNKPYSGIKADCWTKIRKGEVYYLSPKRSELFRISKLINNSKPDLIYLNSFFSWHYTIKPLLLRRLGIIPIVPIIIAPRGELSGGALGIKSLKKKAYLLMSRLFKMFKGITWQASSEYEKKDIRSIMGENVDVLVAPDLPAQVEYDSFIERTESKIPGFLKCVFISRISPMKNLTGALEILHGINGQVEFTIYGALEDIGYWKECWQLMHNLPDNIKVEYKGLLPHEDVIKVFSQQDLFLFPTWGENFGHVILESLVAGCPVLISDQTPWRNLYEEGVGWDIPLEKPEIFQEVLQKCVDMGDEEFRDMYQRAREYGIIFSNNAEIVEANRNLFRHAVAKKYDLFN